jgi:CsoR family transcriptional regulator, copper-sensing transcriptional repressor
MRVGAITILRSRNGIERQVRGVAPMVEADQYCLDVLTQLSAIISASRRVGLLVLEDHIRGCVINSNPDEAEHVLDELSQAIERFTRVAG